MLKQELVQLELFKISNVPVLSLGVRFNFIDLFSGIGGFRIPLEQLGGRCLGYSEIDKSAIQVYQQNFIGHNNYDEIELGNIENIQKLPDNIDLLVGGVPCQPWSVAGKLQGFADPRGKLWFDVIRLLKANQPKSFIFENVRGLANPKNQKSFNYLLEQFRKIHYCVQWKVINSYDFGVPQNRERVFIVGIRNDLENCDQYQFPQPLAHKPKLLDVIEGIQNCQPIDKAKLDPKVLFGDYVPPSRNRFQKDDELNDFFIFSDLRNGHTTIHSWNLIRTTKREKLICLTILKNRRRKKYGKKDGNPLSFQDLAELIPRLKQEEIHKLISKKILRLIQDETDDKYEFVNSKNSSGINNIYRVFLPNSDMMPTLTATGTKDYIATEIIYAESPEEYKKLFLDKIYKPRKIKSITAQDASRLQGFPTWFKLHENEAIAKRQLGNAVSISVVYHIAQNLLNTVNLGTAIAYGI
ncbi:MAG: DNA cytosine methyltransferase [Symploca sp. SIO2D2]|nr:DNA cytosine methyltransferase [Symploca sp. SIO2D2]